ncbi:MAG TPA: hexose kinase [Bacillaceae bacterium]
MILSVTMNPSVDISYALDSFKLNDVNRVDTVRKTAGGKGLNVARVISQMGSPVLATGVLGGTLGEYIVQELNRDRIRNDFLKMDQESRNCIAILHEGLQTEILESGPTLSLGEGDAFLKKFEGLLAEGVSLVTISGSLPKGLDQDYYHQMLQICRGKGIPAIVDTSVEALKQVLLHEEKPFAIKPNAAELSQLLGVKAGDLGRALRDELFDGIEWVMVSLGSEGAFVRHGGDFFKVSIPKVEVVNPVGSGDATVAGLAVALVSDQRSEDVLKTAMTAGVLNAMEAGTGSIDLDLFNHYFDLVKVEKVDG